MSLRRKNILIIGQGIAGSILSFKLWQKNIKHKVLDNGHKDSATKASGGVINPITGRKFVKSWKIDDLLPSAIETYAEISKLLDSNYLHKRHIIRSLKTPAQENKWFSRIDESNDKKYFVDDPSLGDYKSFVVEPMSAGETKNAYQVNVRQLILDYRSFLEKNQMLLNDDIEYSEISSQKEVFEYKGNTFDLIIFCEGYRGMYNPFFDEVKFSPAKGESFIIDMGQRVPQNIFKDEIFLVPQDETTFWTGGSYNWDVQNSNSTKEFEAVWNYKLKKVLKVDYKIIAHRAGVRPASDDRRPFIGSSPQNKALYMFNGMGTKGTSLSPYWADHFIEHLDEGIKLDKEVDLKRFYK